MSKCGVVFKAVRFSCIWLVAGVFFANALPAQDDSTSKVQIEDPMELQNQVDELILQLDAPEIPLRDAAEKRLVAMGSVVLPFLKTNEQQSSNTVERILRIRLGLEKLAAQQRVQPTKVTLTGNLTAFEAVAEIGKQSGNSVQIMEGLQATEFNKPANYQTGSVGFWSALLEVCNKHRLQIDPYQSNTGMLMLVPMDEAGLEMGKLPGDRRSVFNVEVQRIDASRNLENPNLGYYRLKCRVRWEPRITPSVIDIPLSSIKILDEFDKSIDLKNSDGVISCTVQEGLPEVEFAIPLGLIDRQVEIISRVEMELNAIIPGKPEVFSFEDLTAVKAGAEIKKAGATFIYDGTRQLDEIYAVSMRLRFDEASKAMESYQGWVYNNPLVLKDRVGESVDNIGMETLSRTESEIGMKYFFDQNPLEYGLEYQSPASIVKLPIKIQLKGIPLP